MRFVIAGVLLVHALLHLIGFVGAFGWAPGEGRGLLLSTPPGRGAGVLWLTAAGLLLVAAGLLAAARERWWVMAAAGLFLSQVLIVGAWADAKAGTIVNVLLVPVIIVGAAQTRFHGVTDATVRDVLARVTQGPADVVTDADLAPLPAPVRRWLAGAGVVGRPRTRAVWLKQTGALRTTPAGAWMPAHAEQVFTVDEPAFVWQVDVRLKRVVPVLGRDSYVGGHGRMLITAGALVPVVDAAGPEIDQGTLLRYLGEIVWFPSAALAPYVTWSPIDDRSARARMSHRGVSAEAVFEFDPRGYMVRLTAERYQGGGGEAAHLVPWEVRATDWRVMAGVLVPVAGQVSWHMPAGEFSYYRWRITDLAFDTPEWSSADASPPPDPAPLLGNRRCKVDQTFASR